MTTFELLSIGAAYGVGLFQCGLIAWGIWVMRQSNKDRAASTTLMLQQAKALERMTDRLDRKMGQQDTALAQMGAGIGRLLEQR